MITTNPLFLLAKMAGNTRTFVAASTIACYGLFLYELLPEYLFIPTYALFYFVLPSIVIVIVLVILPKMLSRNVQAGSQASAGLSEQTYQPPVEAVSIEPMKEQGMILPDGNNTTGESQDTIQNLMAGYGGDASSAAIQTPIVDEAVVQDMVSRVMEPVQKDNARLQDTIINLRNEIDIIKSNMDSMSSTVESSLTDLKSFQAELANPLNFMRKYFDSIDIKSLSDPTLPLHIEQLPLSDPTQGTNSEKTESDFKIETQDSMTRNRENTPDRIVKDSDAGDILASDSHEVLAFKQILGGKITLGKLMTTISLMEEILQTLGRDSIDVLIDQCKLMGLNQEDEHIVYNVINMMDKSGLSVNDTLIMLYKFGKVMGMNDRESDLIYAKLMMNQGKNHDNIMTVEKKAE
ncbi:MAG: hypothetical protein KGH88_01245 [Thaumarchaeota archaeon]|nr:hypothetical protein [Nitrososphaerota archaeon]